jgi:formamidase
MIEMIHNWSRIAILAAGLLGAVDVMAQDDVLVLGGEGRHCGEDAHCFNRLHPEIPMAASALPGQTIVLRTRNAADTDLDPGSTYVDPREGNPTATVHPLTGPVFIEGAQPGDVLAVTILDIEPGPFGFTVVSPIGFVTDQVPGPLRAVWRLSRIEAVSADIPGVTIPNASFPGIVTVLPGPDLFVDTLRREAVLAEIGGAVSLPEPTNAYPSELCGERGTANDQCLRTAPPREHGGNMDIRYLGVGATIYLPCYLEGCGLAVGDLHFAQGDGEVSGTAIEMDATVTLSTALIKDGPRLDRGPHYEGPGYLESPHVAGLENLSKDISLAARNALLEMIDYIVATYGLTPAQAYIVASVAVDLRIGQLVDAPNVGVTAILPLDIFE